MKLFSTGLLFFTASIFTGGYLIDNNPIVSNDVSYQPPSNTNIEDEIHYCQGSKKDCLLEDGSIDKANHILIPKENMDRFIYNITLEYPLGKKHLKNDKDTKKAISCLAKQVWEEAAKYNPQDMISVAYSTIDRVKSKKHPNDICSVVTQKTWSKSKGKYVCQMSWACDKRKNKNVYNFKQKDYIEFATAFLHGKVKRFDRDCKATHWYNSNPKFGETKSWNFKNLKTGNLTCSFTVPKSTHVFYRPKR